jgi:NADH-quinone oxidoreductase subunit K
VLKLWAWDVARQAESLRHIGGLPGCSWAEPEGDTPMMTQVPISWFLTLSAILFALGVAGFLFRRSIITVFMSIELMLNAVNLSFVTFSYQNKSIDGHLFAFFVMVVAAAEAAVGLAIILTIFKNRQTLNIDEIDSMKN